MYSTAIRRIRHLYIPTEGFGRIPCRNPVSKKRLSHSRAAAATCVPSELGVRVPLMSSDDDVNSARNPFMCYKKSVNPCRDPETAQCHLYTDI